MVGFMLIAAVRFVTRNGSRQILAGALSASIQTTRNHLAALGVAAQGARKTRRTGEHHAHE
jgi:hypothetical protein